MRGILARYGPGKPFRHLWWLLLIFNTTVFSQQVFWGKVTNREGVSLVGATVSVNGTNNIAATDSAGVFTLTATSNNDFIP